MMSSYVCITRGSDGDTFERTRLVDGKLVREQGSAPRNDLIPKGHLSTSNGIVGDRIKREHEKFDAEHGMSDVVSYEPVGHHAYRTKYKNAKAYQDWNRLRKRVNHNAGCGMPAPGDFGGYK